MVDTAKNYAGLYAKALAGAAVAGLGAYSVAIQDGSGINGAEWFTVLGTVLFALGGIFLIPNVPEGVRVYGKAILGAVIALAGSLGTGLADGSLSQLEVVSGVIAFIVALGLVGVTSNAAASDPVDPATNRIVPVTASDKNKLVLDSRVSTQPQVILED